MHVTDWFTTILRVAGLSGPSDRVIDGVDQLDWLTGEAETSQREGYIYWMGPQMYGVKWRNFKLVLVAQKYTTGLEPADVSASLHVRTQRSASPQMTSSTPPRVDSNDAAGDTERDQAGVAAASVEVGASGCLENVMVHGGVNAAAVLGDGLLGDRFWGQVRGLSGEAQGSSRKGAPGRRTR